MRLRHRLGNLKRRVLLAWARLRGKHIVHFIHVSKTGGTAVRFALQRSRPDPRFHMVFHPHSTALADVLQGEQFFFFLRDPAERFVSGFYSRQNEGRPRYHVPWNELERQVFTTYESPNALALALASNSTDERQSAQRAMRGIGLVSDCFSDWFGGVDAFEQRRADLLFVGFQESLATDFETLAELLRYPEDITLPGDPVAAHRGRSDVDRQLDAEALAALREWYAEDYRFLEHCRALVDELQSLSPDHSR